MPSWFDRGTFSGGPTSVEGSLEPEDIGGNGGLGSLTVSAGVTELSGELEYTDLTIDAGTALAATAGELLWVRCTGNLDVQGALHADGRGLAGGLGGVGADDHEVGRDGESGAVTVPAVSGSGSGGGGGSGGNPQSNIFSSLAGGRGGSGNPSSLSGTGRDATTVRYRKIVCPLTWKDGGGIWVAAPDTPYLVSPLLISEPVTNSTNFAATDDLHDIVVPFGHIERLVAKFDLAGSSNKEFNQILQFVLPPEFVSFAGQGISLVVLEPDTQTGSGNIKLRVLDSDGNLIVASATETLDAGTTFEERSHIYLSSGVAGLSALVAGEMVRLEVEALNLFSAGQFSLAEFTIEIHEKVLLSVDFLGGAGGQAVTEIAGEDGSDGIDAVILETAVRDLLEDGFASSYVSRRSLALLRPGAGGAGGAGGGASGNHEPTTRAGGAAGTASVQTGAGLGHGIVGTAAPTTSTNSEISDSGGGGASGGAGGGRLMVEVAGDVVIGGSGRISANGGDGADGGVGGSNGPAVSNTSNGGSGGGSSGGGGGSVLLLFSGTPTNVTSSTVTADAGAVGLGGAAATPGNQPEQIGGAGGDAGASENGFAIFHQVS